MRTRKKDSDFTNIRVHIKTHEELDAIGERGESMDDIVKKCLAAYKAQQPQLHIQPQQQPQQLESQQQKPSDIFSADTVPSIKKGDYVYMVKIPKLKFPINKLQLIEHIKKVNSNLIESKQYITSGLLFAQQLPADGRTDKDKFELEGYFSKYIRDHKEIFPIHGNDGSAPRTIVAINVKIKDKDEESAISSRKTTIS